MVLEYSCVLAIVECHCVQSIKAIIVSAFLASEESSGPVVS